MSDTITSSIMHAQLKFMSKKVKSFPEP